MSYSLIMRLIVQQVQTSRALRVHAAVAFEHTEALHYMPCGPISASSPYANNMSCEPHGAEPCGKPRTAGSWYHGTCLPTFSSVQR